MVLIAPSRVFATRSEAVDRPARLFAPAAPAVARSTRRSTHELARRRRLIEPACRRRRPPRGRPAPASTGAEAPLDDDALAAWRPRCGRRWSGPRRRPLDVLGRPLGRPIDVESLRDWPAEFPDDIAAPRRVPDVSRADSVMYCQVLAEARRRPRLDRPPSTTPRPSRPRRPASSPTRPDELLPVRAPGWAHRGRRHRPATAPRGDGSSVR